MKKKKKANKVPAKDLLWLETLYANGEDSIEASIVCRKDSIQGLDIRRQHGVEMREGVFLNLDALRTLREVMDVIGL